MLSENNKSRFGKMSLITVFTVTVIQKYGPLLGDDCRFQGRSQEFAMGQKRESAPSGVPGQSPGGSLGAPPSLPPATGDIAEYSTEQNT